jgi:Protein of unknown function (DUF3826)
MKKLNADNYFGKKAWAGVQHMIAGTTTSVLNVIALFVFLLSNTLAIAQSPSEKEVAYRKVLHSRSEKIVADLAIKKNSKKEKITNIIAEQYYQLNKLHDNTKAEAAIIKTSGNAKETIEQKIKEAEESKVASIEKLHKKFITRLNSKLTDGQVDKVKDGMTYNVMNVTYAAYNDMVLSLTEKHKKQILSWLKEAREKAMDEGSSDDKHKVFGKYKGRINNYLSSEGYDMKKEEKAWQQRLREKREKTAADKNIQSV